MHDTHNDRRAHERALVAAFIISEKRARIVESLENTKHRPKFLNTLNHFHDLDPRWLQPIPANEHTPAAITVRLHRLGAPAACWVISSNRDLDGRHVELLETLSQVVGRGEGTLLSCLPGELAYFEGEEPEDRVILHRPTRAPRR